MKKLERLRGLMKQFAIDCYIITGDDSHHNEYMAVCDKRMEYISEFTGSNGFVIVTYDRALLWTDGRYFLQAEHQIDADWTLMKYGVDGFPGREEWIYNNLESGNTVGVNPLHITAKMYELFSNKLEEKNIQLRIDIPDLVDLIWNDRPSLPSNKVFLLDIQFSGESMKEKIERVYNYMERKKISYLLLSDLQDIAWLTNMRGSDISYNPLFLSYVLFHHNNVTLYVDSEKLTDEVKAYLSDVVIKPYSEIYKDINIISEGEEQKRIEMDIFVNQFVYSLAGGHNNVNIVESPVRKFKAIKNQTELEGAKESHLRDSLALCRFFSWLDTRVRVENDQDIDEIVAENKLEEIRSKGEHYMGPSFETISAYGSNASIIHYRADVNTSKKIGKDNVYLCDSGAHYKDGTTDVTRVFHYGDPTPEQKRFFTLVLKGHIALSRAVFPQNTSGHRLDTLARQYLWRYGADYHHGTGHGVGSFLNVHEGPQHISTREASVYQPLETGMIITNEPGYYKDNSFGIRIESVMVVCEEKLENTDKNACYKFETLTKVPIQVKLVDLEVMDDSEIEWLNTYHRLVLECLEPLLLNDPETLQWLKRETFPIERQMGY